MIDIEDLIELLRDFRKGDAGAAEVAIKLEGLIYDVVDSRMKEWLDGNS